MNDFNERFDNVENNDSANQTETEQNIVENEEINFNQKEKQSDGSVWNKVNFSEDAPVIDYRPMNKGLRAFALILSAVVILAAGCTAGYFWGKKSVPNSYIGAEVEVDLEAKPTNSDSLSPAQVYQKVDKSIVGIRVYNETGAASDASGVIYSEDGYIVTNDHIYSEIGAPKFKVFMYDGSEYDAVYVAGDSISDLAVLKIENVKGLQTAVFGNSNELVCGENVVAVGRPSDATDSSSITTGVISLTKRRVKTTSSFSARLIQTDSAINPGSSGGALVNMYGQVVGITSAKLAGVVYEGIGYAIPTTTMKRVVEQLISEGKVVDRAKLGITYTEVNSVTAEINGYDDVGLYIVSVGEESVEVKDEREGIAEYEFDFSETDGNSTVRIRLDRISPCTPYFYELKIK